jgi:hypothetical protein
MELSEACMLSEGEEIIFDDGNIGRNQKLVLTNKRLIFSKVKGTFSKSFKKDDEIPIEDIESAQLNAEYGTIMLQLKNGEKDVIDFHTSESFEDVLMNTDHDILDVRLQATIDRWVNEINRLAVRVPKMIYCRYCGAKNKSTETKCVHCGALLS